MYKSGTSIVLFHRAGEQYLKKMVFHDLEYTVFDPVNDIRYDIAPIIKSILKCINRDKKKFLQSIRSTRHFKTFLRKVRAQLIADQLRELKPKVILTFIDNCNMFHLVCVVYKEIPFLAIQNGGRHIWCATEALPDPDLKYHIDEYFCFGHNVQALFEEYGHDIKKYIHCGSLLGGYFLNSRLLSNAQRDTKYDLCLVSQWKNRAALNAQPLQWSRAGESINVVTEFAARYALDNDIRVCVALRTNDPAECDFYEALFRGNCVFQEQDRLAFSSYKSAFASNLVVAINTTLATEVFGMGLKVLFVNPSGEECYKTTNSTGSWYLSEPDYEAFSERVDSLLKRDLTDYLAEARSEMKAAASYDPDRPMHKLVRERLLQLTVLPHHV